MMPSHEDRGSRIEDRGSKKAIFRSSILNPRSSIFAFAGVLLAVAVLALGIVWFVRARTAAPSPPQLDLHDVEPGLAEAVKTARRGVEQAPRSAAAWGHLGMVLRAHDFNVEANRCFAQAEKLDP